MIKITEDLRSNKEVGLGSIWIGNSDDESSYQFMLPGISAILNVAVDLKPTKSCSDNIEVAQVGLIDGPGNELLVYVSAVLELRSMLRKHRGVLVCCHDGGRALAVATMHLFLAYTSAQCTWAPTWEGMLDLMKERVGIPLPKVHEAHKEAFGKIRWRLLSGLMA